MVRKIKKLTDLKKFTAGVAIRYALDGIQRINGNFYDLDSLFLIKPFLHKINITTDWNYCKGSYKILQDMFGKFYVDDKFTPNVRMPNYRKRLIKSLTDFDIYFFTDSMNFAAPNLIEIHPKENTSTKKLKKLLHSLNTRLVELSVSSVEYSIDLYCRDHESRLQLFNTLKRHLHVPYSRGASHYGQEINLGNNVGMNSIIRMGDIKMYERGIDGKKGKSGWNNDECDRIRLELSASRDMLRKYGIKTLTDLIDDPKFQVINGNLYQFKWFEGSNKLPNCCDPFLSADAYGNDNCLQYEINNFRPHVKNLNQYLKDVDMFEPFKKALNGAMLKYDREWKNEKTSLGLQLHNMYPKVYKKVSMKGRKRKNEAEDNDLQI